MLTRWMFVTLLLGCGSKESAGPAGSATSSGSDVTVVKFVGNTEIDLEGWERRCDQGEVEPCELLANQYSIAADPVLVTRSVELFEKACARNSLLGCYAAGTGYLEGKGIVKDEPKGRALIEKGCDLGHHWACERLKQL